MNGEVEATVPVACGRCLEEFPARARAAVDVRFIPRPPEGDRVELDVHAPYDGDPSEEPVVAIDDLPALAGPEGTDLPACRTADESTGRQPDVEQRDADAGERERGERPPTTAHPDAGRVAGRVHALAEDGDPVLQASGKVGHVVVVGLQILVRVLRKQVSGRERCASRSRPLSSTVRRRPSLVTPKV